MKKSNKYVFDIEVFPNYFCIVLKKLNDDKILIIDSDNFNRQKKLLYGVISKNVLISYAGHSFDDIVINDLLKYRNSNVNRNKLNSEIKIIRNMPKDEYKSENHEFYSYDLAYEYNLNLGVKGFEFNCGDNIEEQDFANFNYVIKKNIYDEIVDKVIDYCLQDVLATEKMYNFIIKEKSNKGDSVMIVKDLLEEINADYFLNFKKELNSNFRRHYKYKLNDEDREKINNDLTKTLSYLKDLKDLKVVNTDSNLVVVPNVDLIENSLIYNIGFLKNKDIQNYNSVCFDSLSKISPPTLYSIVLLAPEIILGLQISNVLLDKYSKKFIICFVLNSLFMLDFDYSFEENNNARISFIETLKANLLFKNDVNNDDENNYKTAEEVFSELREKYGLEPKEDTVIDDSILKKEIIII